jgi:predicted house-cleaning noncanonical NTP pyrophosphatase (MazG superfamily)
MKYLFRCEKLVRDRIPELMTHQGSVIQVETLDHKAHIAALKNKIKEEALELCLATSREDTIEEIADIIEVLDALALKLSIKRSEIDSVKRTKSIKIGGFDRGLFLKTVEASGDSPVAARFLREPLKYPLL